MKIADSVLLSLFKRDNEMCNNYLSRRLRRYSILNTKFNWSHWSRWTGKYIRTLRWSRSDFFYGRHKALNTRCCKYQISGKKYVSLKRTVIISVRSLLVGFCFQIVYFACLSLFICFCVCGFFVGFFRSISKIPKCNKGI